MIQCAYDEFQTRYKVLYVARVITSSLAIIALLMLAACEQADDDADNAHSRIIFEDFARIEDGALNEISGIETTAGPNFIVHNDDGSPDLWLLDSGGDVVRKHRIKDAKNRDWEDLTQFEHDGRSLLAIGDIGDNLGRHSAIRVYFVETPEAGTSKKLEPVHTLKLSYPDGPRDCEAMAFDASGNRLLFMSKRDKPPRLYAVAIDQALNESKLELEFLGTVPTFRPPAREDTAVFGKDRHTISQPTGMDINAKGDLAAVITYRSLYLYTRQPHQSWAQAFHNPPREFLGPASRNEEAIAFGPEMNDLYISSEDHPAPVFRAGLPEPTTSEN